MTLRAHDVCLRLGANAVLAGVSLAVAPGTFAALVGPNGAGKSSLLRVLSGDLAPSRGGVTLQGEPIALFGTRDLAQLRSVMGQSATMAFDFYVEEVLAMGWLGAAAAYREALRDVVRRCALDGLLGRRFNTLSGGESQRVQFARALLQIGRAKPGASTTAPPRYLLLDEPTASLDIGHELALLRLAREACDQNVGVLAVLHDLNLAARFADRVALLHGGAIVADGAPDAVLTAERLSRVYATPVRVENHPRLERLVVYT